MLTCARPELASESPSAGESPTLLTHDRCNRACDLDVLGGEVHVEGDQRPAGTDDRAAGPLIQTRRTEIGPELTCINSPLELFEPTTPEEGRAAAGR